MWTTDETLTADVASAHFGAAPIEQAVGVWKRVGDDGKTVAEFDVLTEER